MKNLSCGKRVCSDLALLKTPHLSRYSVPPTTCPPFTRVGLANSIVVQDSGVSQLCQVPHVCVGGGVRARAHHHLHVGVRGQPWVSLLACHLV